MPAKSKKVTRKRHAKKAVAAAPTVAQEIDAHLVEINSRWAAIATASIREAQRLGGK